MDKSLVQGGTGLILAEEGQEQAAIASFLQAMAAHRHFGREMDPPLV